MNPVIARSGVLAVALLLAVVAACSDDDGAPSRAAAGAERAVESTSPTQMTVATPATVETLPQRAVTTVSRSAVGTTALVPAGPSSRPVGSTTSVPNETATRSSAPEPTPGDVVLATMNCTARAAGTDYDLLHVTVESIASSRYRLTAQYSGDTFQHDVLVSFDLGASMYLVTAELFEDGSGVPRISGADLSEEGFLDPPQTISPGRVDLMIRSDQIARISGTSFEVRVSLKVDGADIETCPG
jgi:hypothetical protein